MATKDLDSLLDSIIAETEADANAPLKPPEPEPVDPALLPTLEELQGPRRWAHDPDARADIAGLRRGYRFTMQDCGEDLYGEWVVVRLDLNHPNPSQRSVTAERPAGGPPYIKMTELDFLDELRQGRIALVPVGG